MPLTRVEDGKGRTNAIGHKNRSLVLQTHTFPLPDNGYRIDRDAYFHVQRTAASRNPPVFIDLFSSRPAGGERGA